MGLSYFFFISLAVLNVKNVFSHGYIEIELDQLSNNYHYDNGKSCCDFWIGSCGSCDTYLSLCVTFYTKAPDRIACNMGQFETYSFKQNKVDYHRNQKIGKDLYNPIRIKFDKWQRILDILIYSYDHDYLSRDDLIDVYSTIVTNKIAPNSSVATPTYKVIQGRVTQLKFNVRVYCDDEYQSRDCSVKTA